MRIGILGGTFNPIHFGHLNLAGECKRVLKLDQVIFIPAKIPPHKRRVVVDARHRYKMVKLAIQDIAGFKISPLELKRRGRSYSIKTVKALHKIYSQDKLFFITGSDSVKELATWRDIDDILKLCTFVVARRPGFLVKRHKTALKVINIKPSAVSSRSIRARLRRGMSVDNLAPEKVIAYIKKYRLYGVTDGK